jgi:predicted phage terminase large subunit-like protein
MDGADDHFRYQSSAYQFIGFDELPQFREEQFRYMFSRLRRLESQKNVPLRMRSAGNPDGRYVQWVKYRYVDVKTAIAPFIPAKLEDNPGLDRESYIDSLMHLDPVTRARLLEGDWEMRDVGAMFRRSWFTLIKKAPMGMRAVRYWDKASTRPSRGKDPDYTAGVLMSEKDGRFYVLDVRHFRGRPAENEAMIKQTAEMDRQRRDVRSVMTYMEQEPGSAGVDVIDHYLRRVLVGFPFKPDRVTGPKEERASAFSSATEAGNVYLLLGSWDLNGYLDELESFPGAEHDDRVDASSGAFRMLTNVPRTPKVRHA